MIFKEVTNEAIRLEVESFIEEYISMVKEVIYDGTHFRANHEAEKKEIGNLDSETPISPVLDVVTLEGIRLIINLSQKGWEIIKQESGSLPLVTNKSDNIYETCEALLMDVSPLFIVKWNEHLMMRLSGLENFAHNRFANSSDEDDEN